MNILIAGGAGYLGTELAPALARRGHEIAVVDLLWFGNHLPAGTRAARKELFRLEPADLRDFDQLLFLAGISNDPMAEFSPRDNFIYNAALPAYLAYLARKSGVKRMVYAGSCSVYGFTADRVVTEEDPASSDYPYGISKLEGEDAALRQRDDGFSVLSLRQGTLSGYSARMRLDLAVNTMFRDALRKREIVLNNPAIHRPILSLPDALDAWIKAVESPPEVSGVFNVASRNYTVGELGERVARRVEERSGAPVAIRRNNVPDKRNYRVGTEKARAILGFAPKGAVEEIVDDLWLNRDRFRDFDNPNYYNIEVFKKIKTNLLLGEPG